MNCQQVLEEAGRSQDAELFNLLTPDVRLDLQHEYRCARFKVLVYDGKIVICYATLYYGMDTAWSVYERPAWPCHIWCAKGWWAIDLCAGHRHISCATRYTRIRIRECARIRLWGVLCTLYVALIFSSSGRLGAAHRQTSKVSGSVHKGVQGKVRCRVHRSESSSAL